MPVEIVPYQMSVPKEGKELIDAISGLIRHIVKGGQLTDIPLALLLPAITGIKGVLEEAKSQYNDELSAYLIHKFWAALKGE